MKTSLVQVALEQGLELRPLGPDRLRVVCWKPAPRAVLSWVQAHKAQLLAELLGDLVSGEAGEDIQPSELRPIPRAELLAQLAALPPEERQALLEEVEERAAILEFEGGQPREEAEQGAVVLVLARYRKGGALE